MSSQVVKASEFKPEFIKLGNKMRDMGNGGKMVYVSYRGEPLQLQTPKLTTPFGLSEWPKPDEREEGKPPQKYTLELSFRDLENADPKVQEFYRALCDLDDKILREGFENSEAWFKTKHKSIDVTDAKYRRCLKVRPDYDPLFKATIPADKDGNILCKCFDTSANPVDPLQLNLRGAQVRAIVRLSGIYFAGGNFGLSFKVSQLCITPAKRTMEGFAFDLEDEKEEVAEEQSRIVNNNNDDDKNDDNSRGKGDGGESKRTNTSTNANKNGANKNDNEDDFDVAVESGGEEDDAGGAAKGDSKQSGGKAPALDDSALMQDE